MFAIKRPASIDKKPIQRLLSIYSTLCASYSSLQPLLHKKRALPTKCISSNATSLPQAVTDSCPVLLMQQSIRLRRRLRTRKQRPALRLCVVVLRHKRGRRAPCCLRAWCDSLSVSAPRHFQASTYNLPLAVRVARARRILCIRRNASKHRYGWGLPRGASAPVELRVCSVEDNVRGIKVSGKHDLLRHLAHFLVGARLAA